MDSYIKKVTLFWEGMHISSEHYFEKGNIYQESNIYLRRDSYIKQEPYSEMGFKYQKSNPILRGDSYIKKVTSIWTVIHIPRK